MRPVTSTTPVQAPVPLAVAVEVPETATSAVPASVATVAPPVSVPASSDVSSMAHVQDHMLTRMAGLSPCTRQVGQDWVQSDTGVNVSTVGAQATVTTSPSANTQRIRPSSVAPMDPPVYSQLHLSIWIFPGSVFFLHNKL